MARSKKAETPSKKITPIYTSKAKGKLASSGLTPEDATHLGIKQLSAAETFERFPKHASNKVSSLLLQYHDAEGKPRDGIYRVRLLEIKKGNFGSTPAKPTRYIQPPDTPPAAYFPTTIDWAKIFDDPGATIHITEGELKAACACKHGFATIALGGVFSFRSAERGWTFLPELDVIPWDGRDVVIIYDSDSATNPNVANAVAVLIAELSRRGAQPRVAALPTTGPDEKVGLDDYLVDNGSDALETIIEEAVADDLALKLQTFNRRFGFVLNPGMVYDEQRRRMLDPTKFMYTLFANEWAAKQRATKDGVKIEHACVAREWVRWPLRRQYECMTYVPGQSTIVNGDQANEWQGWGCKCQKDTVKPWKDLLGHIFGHSRECASAVEAMKWFQNWCLYPLAYPGAKLNSAACLWSKTQGVGKSLIGVTLGRVYGPNYSCISQRELDSDFNGWAARRQFVMIDDLSSYQNHTKASILKSLITQERINVNEKYMPQYALPDTVNYYMTSNKANALYLDEQDRRFFLHEVNAACKPSAFYDAYHAWLDSVGPGALLHYAQNEHDFGDFAPHAPPPRTEAKEDMVEHGRSEVDAWLAELKHDPDHILRTGQIKLVRDVYSPMELLELFEPTRKGRSVTVNQLGVRLREYFDRVPVRVRVNGHRAERLYMIRNVEKWRKATSKAIADHVRKSRDEETTKKSY